MANHPNNKEVSSVIYNKTLPVTQAIATIQSPDAPNDEKYKATETLHNYLTTNVKHVDDNLAHVITPELSTQVDAILAEHKGQHGASGSVIPETKTPPDTSGWSIKPLTPPATNNANGFQ